MAFAILMATFLNFYAGLSGLIAVVIAVSAANILGFDKAQLRSGILSFNALITGVGLGVYFEPGMVFFTILALSSILALILSVALGGWLFKYGLSYLSIPFVLTFWFIALPSSLYENIGLTHRNIFWINEMYSIGGSSLVSIFQSVESIELNRMLSIYLRSLSSIIFQNNIISGGILAIALLISSRIAFSLSLAGFLAAYLFAQFTGAEAASITYYNIGANYMMISIAVGGFFVIPSKQSYLWVILLVPITSIVLIFLTRLMGFFQMPVFSLPYSFITIMFMHFLQQRYFAKGLIITPVQYFSPEKNLYAYQNNKERLQRFLYFPIQLPFLGKWRVTQGYDGAYTHKNEWGKALDFMIFDDEGKSYDNSGLQCENYYCFGKPVTAPADGFVTDVADFIEDNPIGEINTTNNWGNSVVIQHIPGVYTQLSHLKKHSVKFKKGDFVKMGDIVALCGNSGRSPYPHLHFQVQNSPFIGARSIEYPFSYYLSEKYGALQQFRTAEENDTVGNLYQNTTLFKAFNFIPDTSFAFRYRNGNGESKIEHWDVYTDAYNLKYLHSRETNAIAYFTCDNMMFYFTTFYGNRKSLLFHFYLSAFKTLLSDNQQFIGDNLSIHMLKSRSLLTYLNDFTAPFFNLMQARYHQKIKIITQLSLSPEIEIFSNINIAAFNTEKRVSYSKIHINGDGIKSFGFNGSNTKIYAERIL